MNLTSVVYYLKRSSPNRLAQLAASHPAAPEVFSASNKVLGDVSGARGASDANYAAQFALLAEGAKGLIADLDDAVGDLKRRIGVARKVRFVGGAVAAIAGALSAALGFWVKQNSWDAELVVVAGSMIGAVGGMLTLVADHFEKSPSGVQLSFPKDLLELVDARVAVERINRRVARTSAFPMTFDELLTASSALDNAAEAMIRFRFVRS